MTLDREYPAQERRRQRIRVLERLILHNPGQTYKRIAAVISIRFGLLPRTVRKYVDVLLDAGLVVEDEGVLYTANNIPSHLAERYVKPPAAEVSTENVLTAESLTPDEAAILEAATIVSPKITEKEVEEEINAEKPEKRREKREEQ